MRHFRRVRGRSHLVCASLLPPFKHVAQHRCCSVWGLAAHAARDAVVKRGLAASKRASEELTRKLRQRRLCARSLRHVQRCVLTKRRLRHGGEGLGRRDAVRNLTWRERGPPRDVKSQGAGVSVM